MTGNTVDQSKTSKILLSPTGKLSSVQAVRSHFSQQLVAGQTLNGRAVTQAVLWEPSAGQSLKRLVPPMRRISLLLLLSELTTAVWKFANCEVILPETRTRARPQLHLITQLPM